MGTVLALLRQWASKPAVREGVRQAAPWAACTLWIVVGIPLLICTVVRLTNSLDLDVGDAVVLGGVGTVMLALAGLALAASSPREDPVQYAAGITKVILGGTLWILLSPVATAVWDALGHKHVPWNQAATASSQQTLILQLIGAGIVMFWIGVRQGPRRVYQGASPALAATTPAGQLPAEPADWNQTCRHEAAHAIVHAAYGRRIDLASDRNVRAQICSAPSGPTSTEDECWATLPGVLAGLAADRSRGNWDMSSRQDVQSALVLAAGILSCGHIPAEYTGELSTDALLRDASARAMVVLDLNGGLLDELTDRLHDTCRPRLYEPDLADILDRVQPQGHRVR